MTSVPYSCKSANKLAAAACKKPISTAIFFFSISIEIVLITYNITYQNTRIVIKWKHLKYHTERSKYLFYPRVEIFSIHPEVKVTCIPKKSHPRVNFTSPTCNMPLSLDQKLTLESFHRYLLVVFWRN